MRKRESHLAQSDEPEGSLEGATHWQGEHCPQGPDGYGKAYQVKRVNDDKRMQHPDWLCANGNWQPTGCQQRHENVAPSGRKNALPYRHTGPQSRHTLSSAQPELSDYLPLTDQVYARL